MVKTPCRHKLHFDGQLPSTSLADICPSHPLPIHALIIPCRYMPFVMVVTSIQIIHAPLRRSHPHTSVGIASTAECGFTQAELPLLESSVPVRTFIARSQSTVIHR